MTRLNWVRGQVVRVFPPRVRLACALTFAAVVLLVAACSNKSTTPTPTPTPSSSATTSPTPTGATPTPVPQNFVSVSTAPSPTVDPVYGQMDGFGLLAAQPTASPASTPAPTEVVMVPANQTIVFVNFDTTPHTASQLVPASGAACSSYPSSPCFPGVFNNTNGTVSLPAGTAISLPQFSTGTIGAGGGHASFSAVYSTGAMAGIFFFGDYFGYDSSPPIRGIIVVL
ncbi:MAG: hypothetical protein JO347_07595 [Candidatus Eremiobacteraeota bacterium]|nr:hypothetical protein [Candidatus Eremiobacteraeota bacterium]